MSAPQYFRTTLTRGGPVVGLKIWRGFPTDPDTGEVLTERPMLWRAQVNGVDEPIQDVAPWFLDGTGENIRGEPCNEAEYRYLSETAAWAKNHAPNEPAANPRKAIDHLKTPALF